MSRANGSVQAPQDDLRASLEADNLELRKRLELSTETIGITRDENNLLRDKVKASDGTIKELERRLRETHATTGAGQADLQRLADELASVKKQLGKATSDFNAEFGKTQEQAQEIERVKKVLGTQRDQIGKQNKEIRDKNDAIAELESANQDLLQRIRNLTTLVQPAAAAGGDDEDGLFEANSESGSEHEA
jgi:chromosome segregation ATPase